MMSLAEHDVRGLLAAIALKTPAPGGGATACVAGALAAAQAEMVVAYSLGKKDLAVHQERLSAARAKLERGRAMLLELGDEDAEAYSTLNQLQRLPEGDARKAMDVPSAALACVQIPLAALAACVDLLALMVELTPITNRHLRSDLLIAGTLAEAAARACDANVRVNLGSIADEGVRAGLAAQAKPMLARAREDLARVQAAVVL